MELLLINLHLFIRNTMQNYSFQSYKKYDIIASAADVPVAQLDRVSDSDSDGCRFDPCRVRQNIIKKGCYGE